MMRFFKLQSAAHNDTVALPPAPRRRVASSRNKRRVAQQVVSCLLVLILIHQPNMVIAASLSAGAQRGAVSSPVALPDRMARSMTPALASLAAGAGGALRRIAGSLGFGGDSSGASNAVADVAANPPATQLVGLSPTMSTITDAAISRGRPSLNNGRIEGSLRVFSGESFGLNSGIGLTSDIYLAGTPTITKNGGSNGGIVNDGGSTTPTNYQVTFNNVTLPGKIHKQANPVALPSDIPTSVPAPSGTRVVNINAPADVANIGNWQTLKTLNVNAANLTINVPPGNYYSFAVNGGSRLNFTTGVYNIADTINLNGNTSVQSTGAVVINIGQTLNINAGSFIVGQNTAPGDVRINVLGNSVNINAACQVVGLLRAVNASVALNGTSLVRGQVIANQLNINGGKITGAVWPARIGENALMLYGPRRFEYTAGGPNTFSEQFSLPACSAAPYKLSVQNGTTQGTNRVSGATVKLNGATVLTPSDVNQNVGTLERSVTPSATNTVEVTLSASAAGSYLAVSLTSAICQPDNTAPTISITSPGNNTTTSAESITVSGQAADTGPGASGIAHVYVGQTEAAYNAAAGTWTLNNVALAPGANQITARAVDHAGKEATAQVNVTRQVAPPPDLTPPALSISTPAPNMTTQEEAITVSGTATDSGANASGVAQVTVNGRTANFDPATGAWSLAGFALVIGVNSLEVRATDNAGNPTVKTVTVTRQQPPDMQAPILNITAPADNTTTQAETVDVVGTVSDPGVNASGVASVTVNNVAANLNASNGSWIRQTVPLTVGVNTITVRATDGAGNPAQQSITITRQLPPDTQASIVEIASPANDSITPNETITVNGTAVDNGNNATGVRRVLVNGREASYDPATSIWTATGVPVQEGSNTITAEAFDGADTPNRGTASINVIRRTPDTQPPTVLISSPLDLFSTYDSTVTVTGTATDDGLNAAGVERITVNGQQAVYNATTREWTATNVPLALGENILAVVATDGAPAHNEARAEVRVTRLRIDPPTLTVSNPPNGAFLSSNVITVSGSVSSVQPSMVLTVMINGQSVTLAGGQFAKTISLSEGANTISILASDALGQQAQASLSVISDRTPPTVSLGNVPPSVMPGGGYSITAQAADAYGIADVVFQVDGVQAAIDNTAPYEFTLAVPSPLNAGQQITITAIARDLTGASALATAQTITTGPGGISGYVFDDATGYVLGGASALLNGASQASSDEQGNFAFVSLLPTGYVRVSREGYTPVERLFTVEAGAGAELFDARLTPTDAQANPFTAQGATATGDGGRLAVQLPANAYANGADVRLTSVSPQGLANLLPFGWSPVPGAVVDVRVASSSSVPAAEIFPAPAQLTITQTPGLAAGTALVLARYDEAEHGWKVLESNVVAGANGALAADLPGSGQYAFLVADTAPTAPPAAVAGQFVPSGAAADSALLNASTARAVASPATALYSATARSTISFVANSPARLPSGVAVEATFDERYQLFSNKDPLFVERPSQDFVLYAYPAASAELPNQLGAFFVAKPTRTDFNVGDVLGANVHVELTSGRQAKAGVLVGSNGGEVRAGNGAQLVIPANALPGAQPIFFDNVATESLGLTLPEGYETLGAYELDLSGASLAHGATISVPAAAGDEAQMVVARLISVNGQRVPKVVARVAALNGKWVSTVTGSHVPPGVTLPGVTQSGRYLFVRVPHEFGYVTGTVSSDNSPAGSVKVSADQMPFVDVTGSNGRYVILGRAGAAPVTVNNLEATALLTDATGNASATLAAQNASASANIALSSVALGVVSVTPVDGAQSVIVTTPVTVTFTKPVVAASLTGTNFKLTTATGNPVLSTITLLQGNRVAVLTPNSSLAGGASYRVVVSQAVRDLYGRPMAAGFASTFTTANSVPVEARLTPQQIRISYPDSSGTSTISIPANSIPPGSTILVVNNTSGATLSTTAGSGALELQIPANVGDEIMLIIRQPDGIEYRVSQAAYRRPDGVTVVGANGGTVESANGQIHLDIPSGAISGQAELKIESRAETDITIPRTGEMNPADVIFGGGVRITASGNFTNDQEMHLEIPASAGAVEGQRVGLMKPSKVVEDGVERDVWEVVTSGKVEGGKLKTMSPPFIGLNLGTWAGTYFVEYYYFIPRFLRAVTGTVTERVPNGAPKPLNNVVVTITNPSLNDRPQVITRTNAYGQFGILDYRISSTDAAEILVTDNLNRTQKGFATLYTNINASINQGLDGMRSLYASVQFPSSTGLPETSPALLRMEGRTLELPDGQPDTLLTLGRIAVGARVEVKTTTTPDVQQITGQLMVGGSTLRQLAWTRDTSATGVYKTDFTVDAEGSYSVVVTTHTQRNVASTKATQTFGFVALSNPNTRPPLDGPPRVLTVTPANLANQVGTGTRIHLEFNEPVKNLVPGQTVKVTEVASGVVIEGQLTSGGLPINSSSPNISSIDFQPAQGLEGNKEYAVEVTTDVRDTGDPSQGLDQNYTSPEDTSGEPFRSTFKTFSPLVLTETPPQRDTYRIAVAGELAITVTPGFGSTLFIYNVSDPQLPKHVGNYLVPNYAVAYDIFEAERTEDIIRVETPSKREYTTVAVVATTNPRNTAQPINLIIYNLNDPTRPSIIGAVSLNVPDAVPVYPTYVKIHGKRAYIGNVARGGVEVVDLEEAVRKMAVDGPFGWFQAVIRGYSQGAKKQKATYGSSETESAPVFSLSVMDQVVPEENGAGGATSPVAYVASNRLQMISFDFNKSRDNLTAFYDGDQNGKDDRLLAAKDLAPAGLARDVRAVPRQNIGGRSTDLAVLLGAERLWIFDVTNPRAAQPYPSRSFFELGLGTDQAKRFDVEDSLAYVMFDDRVAVIDITNPARPSVSSVITGIGSGLRWLAVKDGFVYTLDGVSGVATANIRTSIGNAAALVYVRGANQNETSACANPVVIKRADNRMAQDAETIFKVYGHDVPQSANVVIRKETTSGDQTSTQTLATVTAVIDRNSPTNIVVGRARWVSSDPIDRAALYTAEMILDEGLPTQFRAKRVEIPFSYLIGERQEEFGMSKGEGTMLYMLGADSNMVMMVRDQNGSFRYVDFENGSLRSFGLHNEKFSRTTAGFEGLPSGRYMFRLTAVMKDNAAVNDQFEGYVTIDQTKPDKRQPGSPVVNGVEVDTGNLALSHPDIPEIRNRGLSLSLTRFYNSSASTEFNPLGYGWRHNYQALLYHDTRGDNFEEPGATGPLFHIVGGEGSGRKFKEPEVNSGVEARSLAPYHDTLRKNGDGSFDYFTKARVKYHFQQPYESSSIALFNQGYMGNLAYIEEPNGNRLTLSYDSSGRMISVRDSSNRQLQFTYEQALTPLVGAVDTGYGASPIIDCTSRRYLRTLRLRFLQAEVGVAWRITNVKGPNGLEINYEYDGTGNLERVTRKGADAISTSSSDSVWQYDYNPSGGSDSNLDHLLKSVKAPNHTTMQNRETSYEYEVSQPGRPVKTIQMQEGVTNGFSYVFTNGRITSAAVKDGRDHTTTYQFTSQSGGDPSAPAKTVSVSMPRGAQSMMVFDGYGQKLSETDAENMTTQYRYDGRGNVIEQTESGANETVTRRAVYDQNFGKPLSMTDANNQTTTFTLDDRGNVASRRLPNGRVVTMDHDSQGDMTRSTDQYGFTTTFTHDLYGNTTLASQQTSGEQMVERRYSYDPRSRMTGSSGTLDATVVNEYNALDHLLKQTTTDPSGFRDGFVTTMSYHPEGQVRNVTQTGGTQSIETTNEYDGLNRLTRLTENIGGVGTFVRPFRYDRNSNLIEETDRRGVVTTRTFDDLNFLTSVTLAGPHGATLGVLSQTVNKVGNPTRVTNLYNQTTVLEYDGVHRLAKRNVPGGYSEQMTYDGNGNLLTQKDRNGRVTGFAYDPLNRQREVRDALGRVVTISYEDATRTTTRTSSPQGLTEIEQADALGRPLKQEVKFGSTTYTTSYSYDGRRLTVTDPRMTQSVIELSAFGETGQMAVTGADPAYSVAMRYGALGGMKTSTDALSRTTTHTLDSLGRAKQISHPGGVTESFNYDGEGLPLSHTDKRGVVSTMTYDNLGRELKLRVQGATQTVNVNSIAYNDASSTETKTDANNHSTVYVYDGLHRLVSLKNADNKTMTYTYDGVNRVGETDFKGKPTGYEHDLVNRVILVTDRAGQVTGISHNDTGGSTLTTTDRRGNSTVEKHDPLGRLISVSDGGGAVASYEYDGNSNRTLYVDGRNYRTVYSYDKLNRVKTINYASLKTETFAYDAVGNVIRASDGRGPEMAMEYDPLNHLKKRTDALGQPTLYTFDGEGLLLERTDPKGGAYKTTYTYNALGSLISLTDAGGKDWAFDYDGAQNLKSVRDASSHTVAYEYDALNRLTQTMQPEGLLTVYGYDPNSNRTSVTDAKGQTSTITYDDLDRPTNLSYGNTTGAGPRGYTYDYDPEGNATSVSESTSLTGATETTTRDYARTYDARHRVRTTTDPFGHKVSFGYDTTNNLTSMIDAESKETKYVYDALSRAQTVTLPNGTVVSYAWHADGLLQKVEYGAGQKREYAYDDADRLTSVSNTIAPQQQQVFDYEYDPNSNRTAETRKFNGSTLRSVAYDYDLLDRMTKADYLTPGQRPANPQPGQSVQYTEAKRLTGFGYDDVSNRTSQTTQDNIITTTLTTDAEGVTTESRATTQGQLFTSTAEFDAVNRLISRNESGVETLYSYDGNGNLTESKRNNQVIAAYEYDARDQLRRALGGNQQELARYDYDFTRQRLERTVTGSNPLRYVYAGDKVVNEYALNTNNNLERLENRYDVGAGEVVRGEFQNEGSRFYFTDALGSTTGLSQVNSGEATLAASYEYDAWGNYIASTGASGNVVGFTGQRHDYETGLMPLGNGERYYSTFSGRFTQQDSWTGDIESPASLNRYAYTYNNPQRYTDPTGNEPFTIAGLLLIAFLGAVAVNTIQQDIAIRNGERRAEDFSMSEAVVDGTIIGNSYSVVTGYDAVRGRQLSGTERAMAGVEVALEFASVGGKAVGATAKGARVARAGNAIGNAAELTQAGIGVYRGGTATAAMIREGNYGAATLTGLLTVAGGAGVRQSARGLRGSGSILSSEMSAANSWMNRHAPRLNPFNYSFEGMGAMGRNPKYVSPAQRAARQAMGAGDDVASGVRTLEYDSYSALTKRAAKFDEMEHDHIPSFGALKKAKELEFGQLLTKAEKSAIKARGNAMVLPDEIHAASRTYKWKNTAEQIAEDALNLRRAAGRDFRTLYRNLIERGYDPDEVRQAITGMHRKNLAEGVYDQVRRQE